MALKAKSVHWTRSVFLRALTNLPDRSSPMAASLPGGAAFLKTRWCEWVENYRFNSRLDKNAFARTIYNRVEQPRWLVWLAEASGVDQRRIKEAINSLDPNDVSQTQAKELRSFLPWTMIAHYLELGQRRRPRSQAPYKNVTGALLDEVEEIRNRVKDKTSRKRLIDARLRLRSRTVPQGCGKALEWRLRRDGLQELGSPTGFSRQAMGQIERWGAPRREKRNLACCAPRRLI